MESAVYQYNGPAFPGCMSTSIALYIINCRSMCFSLRLEAVAGISAEVKRHRDGDSFGGEAFLLPALIQTISIAPLHVHKCGSESLHITELIHVIACGRDLSL